MTTKANRRVIELDRMPASLKAATLNIFTLYDGVLTKQPREIDNHWTPRRPELMMGYYGKHINFLVAWAKRRTSDGRDCEKTS